MKICVTVFLILLISFTMVFASSIKLVQAQSNVSAIASAVGSSDSNGMISNNELQNKTVSYFDAAKGYLVYPTKEPVGEIPARLPSVVMIHEWWGLNDNIKNMANFLAKDGYVVLAVDLYGGEVANDPGRASQLVQSVVGNKDVAIANLQSAVKYLASLSNVNASRIAALGWCFGGGQSLQLALNSQAHPLAATILYYGTPLVTDKNALSTFKWPVLGIFGDKDQAISVEQINQFKSSLDVNVITNEIHIYKGVGHAFANPSGQNYAAEETAYAWQKTLMFLKKYV